MLKIRGYSLLGLMLSLSIQHVALSSPGTQPGHMETKTLLPLENTDIPRGSIRRFNILAKAIDTLRLEDAAVTTEKIADGAVTANKIAAGALASISGVSTNTPNTLVKRDGNGSFAANIITANKFVGPLTGNVTGNLLGNPRLQGDVTITGSARVYGSLIVDGQSTFNDNVTLSSGTDLIVTDGSTDLGGRLCVDGCTHFHDNVTIHGENDFTVGNEYCSGNTNLHGSLTVGGESTFNDDVTVSCGNDFTVTDGSTDLGGRLCVDGCTHFHDNVTIHGENDFTVGNEYCSGNTNLHGSLTVGGESTFNDDVTVSCGNDFTVVDGATDLGGRLCVDGCTHFHDNVTIHGENNFTVGNEYCSGNTNLYGSLTVGGESTFNDDVTVSCGNDFTVIDGATDLGGRLCVDGCTHFHNDVTIHGENNFTVGNEYCAGDTNLHGDLTVGGCTHLEEHLTVCGCAHFHDDVTVDGALRVGDDENNTVVGRCAGVSFDCSSATRNTLLGYEAGHDITRGDNNIAIGYRACSNVTCGGRNICIGSCAGSNLCGDDHGNICIGNSGSEGDSNIIRIGECQNNCYIQGIWGVTVCGGSGTAVSIDSNGQLGTCVSSRKFKNNINNVGAAAMDVLQLEPVSFRYNADSSNTLQYGLIAEDVANSMPQLVIYNEEKMPQTVRYEALPTLLLGVCKHHEARIKTLEEALARIETRTKK
jgi:hypothetical protein